MGIDVVAAVISRAGRVVGIRKLSDLNIIPIRIGAVPELDAIDQHHFMLRRVAWKKDRKSTRLNSSHLGISYAVFCLKKKKIKKINKSKIINKNNIIKRLNLYP